jgi:hypothetical protein
LLCKVTVIEDTLPPRFTNVLSLRVDSLERGEKRKRLKKKRKKGKEQGQKKQLKNKEKKDRLGLSK